MSNEFALKQNIDYAIVEDISNKNTVHLPRFRDRGKIFVVKNIKDQKVKIYNVFRGRRVLKSNESATYIHNGRSWNEQQR